MVNKKLGYKCLEAMSADYKEKWIALKDHYAPKLNSGSLIPGIVFTPHDYTHHCCNIYDILSKHLLIKNAFKILSDREFFILNTAVLLHDISMSEIGCNRRRHAVESVVLLRKERISGYCETLTNLDVDTFEWICGLIQAHSDEKDSDGVTKKYIEELPEGNKDEQNMKVIAGILRLADELDVSSGRLIGTQFIQYEHAIFKGTLSEYENFEDLKESFKHWQRCNNVRLIKWNDIYVNQIDILLNEPSLRSTNCEPCDIIDPIVGLYDKINAELNYLNRLIFNKIIFSAYDIVHKIDQVNIVGLDVCNGLPPTKDTPYGILKSIAARKGKFYRPLGPFDVEDLVEMERHGMFDAVWVLDRDFSTDMDNHRQNNYYGVLSGNLKRNIPYTYFVPRRVYEKESQNAILHFDSPLFKVVPVPNDYGIPGDGCTFFNPQKSYNAGGIGIKDASVEGQFMKPGFLLSCGEFKHFISDLNQFIHEHNLQQRG